MVFMQCHVSFGPPPSGTCSGGAERRVQPKCLYPSHSPTRRAPWLREGCFCLVGRYRSWRLLPQPVHPGALPTPQWKDFKMPAKCVNLWISGGFYALKFEPKPKFWLQCKHSKLVEFLKIASWSRFTVFGKINTNTTYWEVGSCIAKGDTARVLVKLFTGVRKV